MSIDLSQFQQTFIDESLEGLDEMENILLHLEVGSVDSEQINSIFRAAHSIKGGSATFGFDNVSSFTHVLETLLDEMRDGKRELSSDAVDVMLKSVDILRSMIHSLQSGSEYDEELATEIHQQLNNLLNTHSDGKKPSNTFKQDDSSLDETEPESKTWEIHFVPHANLMQTGNDPVRMIREIMALGDAKVEIDTSGVPLFDDFVPEDCYLSWKIRLQTLAPKRDIEEIFAWVEDECDLSISEISQDAGEIKSDTSTPHNPAQTTKLPGVEKSPANIAELQPNKSKLDPKAGAVTKASESASIRVSIDKIDVLINMVGELVITQSMLNQFAENEEVTAAQIEQLRNGLGQLERNTRELQESVMGIRMLPISFVFSRFPRMIHDLSQKLGKNVELVMSGESTELDKTVMEKIGDPLVHLVRNAIDHGIETPDIRSKKGKSKSGKVNLNAFHQGGNIVIEISDDGAGLDATKLLAKAREKGIVELDEQLSEDQIYQLIFMPGFSTAQVVSDVSGRGVGMDVVNKNIVSLGGSVEIDSKLGEGTTFRVRLPLTLAILDGQTVKVGEEVYIIPLVSIMESIQIKKSMVRLVGGGMEVFKLREEYLPIIRLHEVFDIADAVDEFERGLLVVVEGGGKRVGLFVDELLGQQQVVIKSLETNFKKMAGISGATILGDGSVAIIIDIPGLIKLASLQNKSGDKVFA